MFMQIMTEPIMLFLIYRKGIISHSHGMRQLPALGDQKETGFVVLLFFFLNMCVLIRI